MRIARQEKSHRLWMVLAAPAFVCLLALVASRLNDRVSFKQIDLTPAVFTVKAGSRSYFPFNVYKAGNVLGRFQAMGGNDTPAAGRIEAVIVDARDFERWDHGQPVRMLYRSEPIARGGIDIRLQPGQYDLVFTNRFSPPVDQTIAASISLSQ